MENFDVWTIVSAVLGLVAVIAGGFWLKAKNKIVLFAVLFREIYDVAKKLGDVLEDDKVTKEEVAEMKKELQDVKTAFHNLIGKEVK